MRVPPLHDLEARPHGEDSTVVRLTDGAEDEPLGADVGAIFRGHLWGVAVHSQDNIVSRDMLMLMLMFMFMLMIMTPRSN